MVYKTVEGILHPDGRLTVPADELPERPVRVMVTLLEQNEQMALADLGDYLDQLSEYEEQLQRGEVKWQ